MTQLVECKTRDRRVSSSRLAGKSGTALSKSLYPLFSAGSTQEDRNRPDMTENC